jgi:hypothetical protein
MNNDRIGNDGGRHASNGWLVSWRTKKMKDEGRERGRGKAERIEVWPSVVAKEKEFVHPIGDIEVDLWERWGRKEDGVLEVPFRWWWGEGCQCRTCSKQTNLPSLEHNDGSQGTQDPSEVHSIPLVWGLLWWDPTRLPFFVFEFAGSDRAAEEEGGSRTINRSGSIDTFVRWGEAMSPIWTKTIPTPTDWYQLVVKSPVEGVDTPTTALICAKKLANKNKAPVWVKRRKLRVSGDELWWPVLMSLRRNIRKKMLFSWESREWCFSYSALRARYESIP